MSRIRVTRKAGRQQEAPREVRLAPGSVYRELRGAVLLAAGLFLLYRMAGPVTAILLLFLIVFIVSAALNPVAAWLADRGVPRMLSAVGLVLLLCGVVTGAVWLVVPTLLEEVGRFVTDFDLGQAQLAGHYRQLLGRFPQIAEQLPAPGELMEHVIPTLGTLLGNLGRYTVGIFTGIFSLVVLLILVIYAVGQPEPLVAGFLAAVPESHRDRADAALRRVMEKLKHWAVGSITVGLIVGTIAGVGLHLLGVPHALLFAVIAFMGEFLPVIGPILAALPPVLLALTIDPWLALWVVIFFVVLQQVESNILTPWILGGHLEIHPVSLIFALLVMHALFGFVGALLAAPVAAIVKICWEEFYLQPTETDPETIQEEASSIVGEREQVARRRGSAH
jgi:putative permease